MCSVNYSYFLQLVFRNVSFRLILIENSIYFYMTYIVARYMETDTSYTFYRVCFFILIDSFIPFVSHILRFLWFNLIIKWGVAVQLTSCAVWCSQGFVYFGPLLRSGTSPKFHWSEVLVPGLRMCYRLLEANGFSYLNIRMNVGHGILFVASWRYYISPDGLDKQHPCLWLAALGLDLVSGII